ncbi:MAG TPA: hypothetical protein PL182_04485, partial [Pseudobdellovibrionaceae bacterium]|nr:hypothetical protein [Pseudobdellovibrionaceae bacterium]
MIVSSRVESVKTKVRNRTEVQGANEGGDSERTPVPWAFADRKSMGAAPKEKPENAVSTEVAKPEEGTLFRLDGERTDLGRVDSLRYNILTWVLNERYDKAIQELREFDSRPSPYPTFHAKVSRYILHSIDLIFAIKAKRNFPGINSLTRAKQQELREKFKEHFMEL